MRIISALLASKKSSIQVFRGSAKSLGKTVTNKIVPPAIEQSPKLKQNASNEGKQQQPASNGASLNRQDGTNDGQSMYRENEMKIQMLSKPLFEQIFKNNIRNDHDVNTIKKYVITMND